MTLETPPYVSFSSKNKGVNKYVRNLTCRYSLSLTVGGFSLCLLLLILNFLQTEDDTTTATTALATTRIDETLGQRSRINQRRRGPSCSLTVKQTRICEFHCVDIRDDPGRYAGDYVTKHMDTSRCSTAELYIFRSKFRERKLSKGWFKADVRLKKVHLESCDISLIDDDAFDGLETHLEKLSLIQLDITVLHKKMISNLTFLKELYLNGLNLTQIEDEILIDFEYFETLQMQRNYYGLSSMLPNITGQTMRSISIADFQYNDLSVLKPDFFTGLQDCKSLYLSSNFIKYIEPKTFFFPGRTQAQIYLDGNRLQTLSEDALNIHHFEKINLGGNEWRCNCSLAWLAKRIRENPGKFEGNITCMYPHNLKGVPLKDVIIEDCPVTTTIPTTDITVTHSPTDDSTTTHKMTTTEMIPTTTTSIKTTTMSTEGTTKPQSTTEKIQTTTPTTTKTTTELSSTDNSVPDTTTPSNMMCNNIDYTDDTNDQPNETYSIKEQREGELVVHVGLYEGGWKLFLKTEKDNEASCWYINRNGKRGNYKLNLKPGNLYLMCIMATERSETVPNNCVAHSMLPNEEFQAWLLNKDAPLVIAGSAVGIVVVSVLVAGAVYATVRHYPTLIKDNKRVILVHHRPSAKFLIMPKGYKGELPVPKEKVRATSLPSSMSPTSSRRSTASTSSTATYVSITESTPMELLAWRLQRLKEKLKRSMVENNSEQTDSPPPPPVPPYPLERIRSLSWRVESLSTGYANASLA